MNLKFQHINFYGCYLAVKIVSNILKKAQGRKSDYNSLTKNCQTKRQIQQCVMQGSIIKLNIFLVFTGYKIHLPDRGTILVQNLSYHALL